MLGLSRKLAKTFGGDVFPCGKASMPLHKFVEEILTPGKDENLSKAKKHFTLKLR